MSKFYCSYYGSKRTELKHLDGIDVSKFDVIVEPFCGTGYMSFYLTTVKGFMGTIVLNDNNSVLIDFFKQIKKDGGCREMFEKMKELWNDGAMTRDEYKEQVKKRETPVDFLFYNKVYNYRNGLYPQSIKKLDYKYDEYDAFMCSDKTILENMDYADILKKYDGKRVLFLFDPPYLSSFNSEYSAYDDKNEIINKTQEIRDNTSMFVDIINHFKNGQGRSFIIINDCAIIRYIFDKYVKWSYPKKYAGTKYSKGKIYHSQTRHLVACNIKNFKRVE